MNGILINAESGDLLIERGSVIIGDTDSQIAEGVLVAMRGEWKEWPLIGGEVKKCLAARWTSCGGVRSKKCWRPAGLTSIK